MKLNGPKVAPYVFLTPFAVIFSVFIAWPLFRSLLLSFTITSGPGAQVFVGTANYRFLLQDPDFWIAVRNTFTFVFFSLVIQVPLSLGLALFLNRKGLWMRNALRFVFFSPHLMGLVFASILFTLLFAPRFGLVNEGLHAITLGRWSMDTRWLSEARRVMPALVMVNLWLYVGYSMIYFLAALQGVDPQLYEAAKVDGAGPFARFWNVTLPGIHHVMIFVVVISTIGGFQLFELPWLLLNNTAGPEKSGLTIVMYLYQNGFVSGDLGYASAIGWTLLFLVFCVSALQLKFSGSLRKESMS
jgi:ABC-type sugar transport system permease subunit